MYLNLMETTLYKIIFNDGRVFNVFCANKNQKTRFLTSSIAIHNTSTLEVIENGIHTIKQWEDILKANK